jgi:hypothetical protein
MEQTPHGQEQPLIPDLPPSEDERGYSLGGYEWMDRLPDGWYAHASWGRDGWDLGNWPYSIVVLYDDPHAHAFAHGVYTEGDIEVTRHTSEAELHAAVNAVALWYWRHHPRRGPPDLREDGSVLSHHLGPFSWARLNREIPNKDDGGNE